MITMAYEFFMTHFFGNLSNYPLLEPIAHELCTIFSIFIIGFLVWSVCSLVAFFCRYISSLGLR